MVLKIYATYATSSSYIFLSTFKAVQIQNTATIQVRLEFIWMLEIAEVGER